MKSPLELLKKSLTYLAPIVLFASEVAAESIKKQGKEGEEVNSLPGVTSNSILASPYFIPYGVVVLGAGVYFRIFEKIGFYSHLLYLKLSGRTIEDLQDIHKIALRADVLLASGQAANREEAVYMAAVEGVPAARQPEVWTRFGRPDKAREAQERNERQSGQRQYTPNYTASTSTNIQGRSNSTQMNVDNAHASSQYKHKRRG